MLGGISIDTNSVHSSNALGLILVTLAGSSMDFKAEQPKKARSPISVTEDGILTEFSFLQSQNVPTLIFVILAGRTMDFKSAHSSKANDPISVMLSCIAIDVTP